MRVRAALVVLVVTLAGCLGGGAPPQGIGVPLDTAGPGWYMFAHAGGPLRLEAGGQVDVEVFTGDDVRLGRFLLGGNQSKADEVTLDIAPGDVVLRLHAVTPPWTLTAADPVLRLRPLQAWANVSVLAASDTIMPEVLQRGTLHLDRPPAAMSLGLSGVASSLRVVVKGAGGDVLEFDDFLPLGPGFAFGIMELPATFLPNAVIDGHLEFEVEATGFSGTLLLRTDAYSRLEPVGQHRIRDAQAAEFLYGEMRDAPVTFLVHDDAEWLSLAPLTNATVHLFDPGDRRILAVALTTHENVSVEVDRGGWYVAYATGAVQIGASHAPSSFDLRALDVERIRLPQNPPGAFARYGQTEGTLDSADRVFGWEPTRQGPTPFGATCGGHAFVLQSGDFVGEAWQESAPILHDAAVLVQAGGFGDAMCSPMQVDLLRYLRPA